ncbi:roadblock/LC7 domain-containing protein [Euzebya tangerina]|uniref:roadblock/LC7 domain-containing protein n=1 Tax=Euzebya tangerina TaxID=591198 RepID=UPI000E321780|nr:roadblock/LC7 domain-containing protein [Euzebya tangerina]
MTAEDHTTNVPISVLTREALNEISLAGLRGWLLSTLDGRWLASSIDGDRNAAAAVMASAHSLATRTGSLLGSGEVHAHLVHTEDGIVASKLVRKDAVLTLLVDDSSNMAQVLHASRRAAELLSKNDRLPVSTEPLVPLPDRPKLSVAS